ncbi:UDP-N-acetylglucosamine 1-carboxyvinyltransferase [Candidatus Babeliales bacterium]|nr:UDP-N-acetylglucosamine 1-carboxyvinyltransferase [Candidatus Babeliales bacterium]
MSNAHLLIKKSQPLNGQISLAGAKNAVLAIMASLLLTSGKSVLRNVPNSADVIQMIKLLTNLGAHVLFDPEEKHLEVDTSRVNNFQVSSETMNKMRASILVMGPLLARFGKAEVATPGGCLIGSRPIDYHLTGLKKLGVTINENNFLHATLKNQHKTDRRVAFEYPSVGATENIMMCATLLQGTTTIINAALEPEVLDLATVLRKMGANIEFEPGMFITITGVNRLNPIDHKIIPDRLEAGSLLLATAITGGTITLTNARPNHMDIFLQKLEEMGHTIKRENGITLEATTNPQAISFKTGPYPGFPTDLQAPMMAALSLANGTSHVEETVFENRLMHAQELTKMGAQISLDGPRATVRGVEELYGCEVIATDIRASCALAIAGLAAQEETKMTGIYHWKRGYDNLEKKLAALGARITLNP